MAQVYFILLCVLFPPGQPGQVILSALRGCSAPAMEAVVPQLEDDQAEQAAAVQLPPGMAACEVCTAHCVRKKRVSRTQLYFLINGRQCLRS